MPGNVWLIPTVRTLDIPAHSAGYSCSLRCGNGVRHRRDERLVISSAAAPVYASARSSTTFAAFPSIKPWTCADQRSRAARRSGSISDLL